MKINLITLVFDNSLIENTICWNTALFQSCFSCSLLPPCFDIDEISPALFSSSWNDKSLNRTPWLNLAKWTWLGRLVQVTFLKKFSGLLLLKLHLSRAFIGPSSRYRIGECATGQLSVFPASITKHAFKKSSMCKGLIIFSRWAEIDKNEPETLQTRVD